jgi:hypothetical protein
VDVEILQSLEKLYLQCMGRRNMLQCSELERRSRVSMTEKQQQLECYKRAAQAHRFAQKALDPAEKADLFAVERGWLSLAGATDDEEKRAA